MVFIYCRVSTRHQEDNYSFPAQKADGIAFAESIGIEYRLYSDVESGAKATRDGWRQLLSDLSDKATADDIVWYGSQSRIMRDAEEFQSFKKLSIRKRFRTYEQHERKYLDFATSKGDRLAAGVKSLMDEEERLDIRDRTLKGLKDSWKAGKRVHTRIYGYDSTEYDSATGNKLWKRIPEEAKIIQLATTMYIAGEGVRNIARQLNEQGYRARKGRLFTHDDVNNMIRKSVYAGLTKDEQGKEIESKLYEPIITIDEYRQLQNLIPTRTFKGRAGRAVQHPCSTILRCGSCGQGFEFCRMRTRTYYRHRGPKPKNCTGRNLITEVGATYLVYSVYVWAILNISDSTLSDIKARLLPSDAEERIERFDKLIAAIEAKIKNYDAAIGAGGDVAHYIGLTNDALKELKTLKSDKDRVISENQDALEKYYKAIKAYSTDSLKDFFQNKEGKYRHGKLKEVIKVAAVNKERINFELVDGRTISKEYKPVIDESTLSTINVIAMEEWDDSQWETFIDAQIHGRGTIVKMKTP